MVPLLILYAAVAVVVFFVAHRRFNADIGASLTAAFTCAGALALITWALAMMGSL
jgi:hypothetical protein